uniref:Uncharacterized protein n=1 Tax=Arundo donax TaxID=35708 RepID=A0A0A9FNU4_ARUDO
MRRPNPHVLFNPPSLVPPRGFFALVVIFLLSGTACRRRSTGEEEEGRA